MAKKAVRNEDHGEFRPRKPKTYGTEFGIVYPMFAALMIDQNLSLATRLLAAYLVGIMDYRGRICRTQKEIADALGTNQPAVSRALKHLEEHWYLSRSLRGRNTVIRLNPHLAWRGYVDDVRREQAIWDRWLSRAQHQRFKHSLRDAA